MKILNLCKPIAMGLFSVILLAGFTGKEKYVELNGFLKGRYSSDFPEDGTKLSLDNSVTVLKAGSTGQILETKKLPSGNYGIHIKVLNGNAKNMNLWIYYNVNHPDVKLFDNAHRPTTSADDATQTESTRDTLGKKPPQRVVDPIATVNTIDNSNQRLRGAGTPPCAVCSVAPVSRGSLVRPGHKARYAMADNCSKIMDSQGQMGPWGQKIFSIMAQQKYIQYFTNNNSLGDYCPNFNSLTNAEKLTAWTWMWAALGDKETDCTLDKSQGGPPHNPREGYGIWTLEKDRNYRLRARGQACSNIATIDGQALCAIDILTQTQLSRGYTASNDRRGYWGPLNNASPKFVANMGRLNLCFKK